MKLSELNPRWGVICRDFTPETGGFPTENYSLSFDCPDCGSPYRVNINVGPVMDEAKGIWRVNKQPNGMQWPDEITVTPSINNTTCGHGRRHPSCSFHGSIINGEIAPSQERRSK